MSISKSEDRGNSNSETMAGILRMRAFHLDRIPFARDDMGVRDLCGAGIRGLLLLGRGAGRQRRN